MRLIDPYSRADTILYTHTASASLSHWPYSSDTWRCRLYRRHARGEEEEEEEVKRVVYGETMTEENSLVPKEPGTSSTESFTMM